MKEHVSDVALHAYGPELFAFLVRILDSHHRAEEVFGQLGVRLWRGLPKFDSNSKMRVWLYGVAFSIAQSSKTAGCAPVDEDRGPEHIAALIQETRDSVGAQVRSSGHDRLRSLRAHLDVREQTLLTLRLDRKFSWPEIAEVLRDSGWDVSTSELSERFHRLKKRMKDLARQEGLL